jgi:hypothetical protein
MAEFYSVPVKWRDGAETLGRAVGNNAAWLCRCGEILLGPHEGLYQIDACPGCGKRFRVRRGKSPHYVYEVEES